MNKSMTMHIIGTIILVFIIILLSIVYVYGSIVTLQNGQCIKNGTNSTICAIQFACPRVNQNISISCPQPICQQSVNYTCPSPLITVENNFTQISQPIISKETVNKYSWVIWVATGLIVFLVVYRTGILNNIKSGRNLKYPKERYQPGHRDVTREPKDTMGDFPDIK